MTMAHFLSHHIIVCRALYSSATHHEQQLLMTSNRTIYLSILDGFLNPGLLPYSAGPFEHSGKRDNLPKTHHLDRLCTRVPSVPAAHRGPVHGHSQSHCHSGSWSKRVRLYFCCPERRRMRTFHVVVVVVVVSAKKLSLVKSQPLFFSTLLWRLP